MTSFYIITWNFNRKYADTYDIMPTLRREYAEEKENKIHYWGDKDRTSYPQTREEIRDFILGVAKYHFWSKCEWEIIVKQWPPHEGCEEKIDGFWQILANIEVITDLLIQDIG